MERHAAYLSAAVLSGTPERSTEQPAQERFMENPALQQRRCGGPARQRQNFHRSFARMTSASCLGGDLRGRLDGEAFQAVPPVGL